MEPCDGTPLDEDGMMEKEWSRKHSVYYNDLIMRKVISYVSDVKDRQKLELASSQLRYLSSVVPYISHISENTVLDLNFLVVEPVMTVNIAGNHFSVKALTSTTRRASVDRLEEQPDRLINVTKEVIKRFSNQIYQIKIGGISDFERRLGYIPDHQLVMTRDLCVVLDNLQHVKSLVLRSLCLMGSVINFWNSSQSKLSRRITDLCIHSIWFDSAEDIDNFVTILSENIRRLYLSDCSGKTVANVVRRLRTLNVRLDILYIAIDYRTFRTTEQSRRVLRDVASVTSNLHICACFSRFITQPGFRILVNVISSLPDFRHITSMELDLGPFRRNVQVYEHFFQGLSRMSNLRILRLFGTPINYDSMGLWNALVQSMYRLSQVEEFSVINLLRNVRIEEMRTFCESLPINLKVLALHRAHHIGDSHLSIISKRCQRLDTLYVRDLRSLTSEGILKALTEFPLLTKIAVCCSGPVTAKVYELLANSEAVPHIEAAIMGGNRDQQSDAVLDALHRRLPQFHILGTSSRWRDCEYHLWRNRQAYEELLAASCYADCPGCGKDVSLIDDDDDLA